MSAARKPEGTAAKKPKRELSEKELAARRVNARKSTGPKTPEGKARVGANAIKHGAFARKVTCITHGALAEDRDEVESFYSEILKDLDPQTAVERALAREIASVAWGQERTQRFTNLALSSVERPDGGAVTSCTQPELNARRWRIATIVLENPDDPNIHWTAFEETVSVLWCNLPDGTETPEWAPDKGIRPETPDRWRALIDLLIMKKWGTTAAAAQWTGSRAKEFEIKRDVEMEERAQLAARTALSDGILEKAMNMTGRLRRDFLKLLHEYAAMKAG
ncbi:MAG: hypothetical protein ACXVKQ_06300 [Acidimicrobiia bacterium]